MINSEIRKFCKNKALEYRNLYKTDGVEACNKKQTEDFNKNVLNATTNFLAITLADYYIAVDEGIMTREEAKEKQNWLFENTEEIE